MDTKGDLRIMSYLGHLRTMSEFVQGKWIEESFVFSVW